MMPSISDLQPHLQDFEFRELFVEGLGWDDHRGQPTVVEVNEHDFSLKPIAEKAGFVVYECESWADNEMPAYPVRRKIESRIAKTTFEHLIVFVDQRQREQVWQWVRRETGKPLACREILFRAGENGTPLLQRLLTIGFSLEEEPSVNILLVTSRVRAALDVEKVTKRFYDHFRKELTAFARFIKGITNIENRDWYASLTLNRLMFVYFIQKQGFLDADLGYLRNRLVMVSSKRGNDGFHEFYRMFLLRLFHEGLGQPETSRSPDLVQLLGKVPFLNGGLFDVHDLEKEHPEISIPDKAFERVFGFFDQYHWHLDERPYKEDNEINPDVLGYIFEKYVNQKQMGAYYTKEDITGYISRNTIIPFLFGDAQKACPVAFGRDGGVWRLLHDDPDRYIYPSVGHGLNWDASEPTNPIPLKKPLKLPEHIAAGLDDVSSRDSWNTAAPREFALPTETWREVLARRGRYDNVRRKLASGEINSINDLVTFNLDIETFAKDVIAQTEGPELLRAFWTAIGNVSVLDPTCGSGAFLFAALNVLEPLYTACVEGMRGFLDDLERTNRPQRPDSLRDFRAVLARVDEHYNERYFILKAIVLNNIYGVDIMEEAVEICKLRLFLKLVAQLKNPDEIEPLPDIDFNVRAGNTLIGFASLEEVREAMTLTPDGQHRAMFPEDQSILRRIEQEGESASVAFEKFRWQQTMLDGTTVLNRKANLRRKLVGLTEELDRYLAGERQVNIDDAHAYEAWRRQHQPFHWFVEFYSIMRKGGFDVVIGNPPFVKTRAINYDVGFATHQAFPDIYAYVLLRSTSIRHPVGRCGFIAPLSLGFSREFKELRRALTNRGISWFSAFDNIPAALFSGAGQRCLIWINEATKNAIYTTRLFRWRSLYRANLMDLLNYTKAPDFIQPSDFGIPRVSTDHEIELLGLHVATADEQPPVKRRTEQSTWLKFSPTARNFISTFIEPPPVLRVEDAVPLCVKTGPSIELSSMRHTLAGLASTAGDTFFWYWLARGDGFHVTNWLLADFLAPIDVFSDDHLKRLSKIGELLHAYRYSSLVFKKNAGKFVGNYNYRHLSTLTRRADLLFLSGIGAEWRDAQRLFSYVTRVRAINEAAGEKGIPSHVKRRYPARDVTEVEHGGQLREIDEWLSDQYQVSTDQMRFLLDE